MANPDKVLEAEERIRAIAAELERMRSATQTLECAKERVNAILAASKCTIEISERLVRELDAHSIASIMEPRFDALKEHMETLSEDVKAGFSDTAPRLNALRERTDALSQDVKTGFSDTAPRLNALRERTDALSQDVKLAFGDLKLRLADIESELRGNRKRQIVIATFAIVTFMAASGSIAVTVLFG